MSEKKNLFKKGVSGNPKGRPRGTTKQEMAKRRIASLIGRRSRELDAIDWEILACEISVLCGQGVTMQDLKAIKQNPNTGMTENLVLSLINKALKEGRMELLSDIAEVASGKKLIDKNTKVELGTAPGASINIVLKDKQDEALFDGDENF